MMADTSRQMTGGVISLRQKACQTKDAKWLCLPEIYRKLYRPNFYDAGSTFIEDVQDCTFTYKTEQIGNQFLLHLFASNSHQTNYSIAVSCNNDLTITSGKVKSAHLSPLVQVHKFKPSSTGATVYISTYHFTEPDLLLLRDTDLFISVQFPDTLIVSNNNENPEYSQIMLDSGISNIKASHDLGMLLNDPIGYDFTIESMDGEKFNVHKLVLSTHSEVFKAMISKEGTAETMNKYVKLVDVPKKDLQILLYFMYTGSVKDMESCDYKRILEFADRYALFGLHQLCQHMLEKHLCEDTVFEILQVADTYNAASLKAKAFKFVKNNPSVIKSTTFSNISYLDLMQELCQFLATS